ncbi:MAG TPA: hypothetical protein VFU88_09115 [Ktedonobacterales bacterium]|nr:hypothetical protein [Ktedonobacterales bacterium]
MTRRVRSRLFPFVALLVLAGCGASAGAAAGCASPNSSPGTQSSGPIVIATDHSTYPADAAIKVTVTNTLTASVFAPDHGASCTILDLQRMDGQTAATGVVPGNVQAGCPLETPTRLIEIAPGKSYTATIHGGYLRPGTFTPGTYRLTLAYYQGQSLTSQRAVIYSQTFTISTCGAATPGQGSGTPGASAGTPVKVTPIVVSTRNP